MAATTVLHVEDEVDIFRIVSNVLGDSCDLIVPNLAEGRRLLESERFDLCCWMWGCPMARDWICWMLSSDG